jgi:hypothetical protein
MPTVGAVLGRCLSGVKAAEGVCVLPRIDRAALASKAEDGESAARDQEIAMRLLSPSRTLLAPLALALAGAMVASMASAQIFPDPGRGSFNDRDPVTGYLCLSPGCDVLQMPGVRCICQKENPSERRLQNLRLQCSAHEGGRWVPCPVQPRFGN